MAQLKDEISPLLVERLAGALSAVSTSFDSAGFRQRASGGLDGLELKARVSRIADALAAALPASPDDAAQLIRDAVEHDDHSQDKVLRGWATMPVNEYVATAMLDRPDLALPLLATLTSRYTAEFAIRPFIDTHYDITIEHLRSWVTSPDEHVRRLVSEGTRPRLPWAGRLHRFIEDPTDPLELLDHLAGDDSLYVRRSVANHLNDISKDHPRVALETARRWAHRPAQDGYVVRHGLRTLVKQGDPGALAVLGFDHDAMIELTYLYCTPSTVRIGETTTISFTLQAPVPTRAAVDYVVHYQGARGAKAGKVFKLAVRDLPACAPVAFSRRHAFRHVSIRTIHPGPHLIEIQANGRVLGETTVDVVTDHNHLERSTS